MVLFLRLNERAVGKPRELFYCERTRLSLAILPSVDGGVRDPETVSKLLLSQFKRVTDLFHVDGGFHVSFI